ncbi:Hypp5107 [Branchiostoma lanceolatum]|uniref:Hypp5107 protein n=1 Tax=Branchiostoma lanceolatum TaxID=7740 RepID=A0A8K0F0C6_BRALA|nr:Hypp5107 [Branchiostoma lanceolatum]
MGFNQTASKWETQRQNQTATGSEERGVGATNNTATLTATPPTLGQGFLQVNTVQIRALDISMGPAGRKASVEVEKHCGIILRNLGDELFNRSSLNALNLEGLAPPSGNDINHRGRTRSANSVNL